MEISEIIEKLPHKFEMWWSVCWWHYFKDYNYPKMYHYITINVRGNKWQLDLVFWIDAKKVFNDFYNMLKEKGLLEQDYSYEVN